MKHLLLLILLFSADTAYALDIKKENFYLVGVLEHTSSIFTGNLISCDYQEMCIDMMEVGIRYKHNGFIFTTLLGNELNGVVPGGNPRATFRIEKEFRLFGGK